MRQWQKKCWGRTRPDEQNAGNPLLHVHHLEVVTGGYCSIHYHLTRANRFIVHDGCICVIEFRAFRVTATILRKGQTVDVPSMVPHMFSVTESGTVTETYWNDRVPGSIVNNDDIVRLCEGSMLKPGQLISEVIREHYGNALSINY